MTAQSLIQKIKKVAYLEGDFVTRAGKKTSYYIDKYLFETQPDILEALGKEMVTLLPPLDSFDRLVAPALGAVSLAAVLSLEINKPFVIAEKVTHATQTHKDILIGDYAPHERVVVLEDVLTTGLTVLNTCSILRTVPLEIVKVISVINREEGADEAISQQNIPVASLISKTDLTCQSAFSEVA